MRPDREAMKEAFAVRLTYYGHSSFLLEAADGSRVIIDPYRSGAFNGALRYGAITDTADAVVATHEHDDHGAVDTVPGHPQILVHPTSATAGAWTITGVDVAHDDEGGRTRGKNTVVVLDDDDVRVVHLGDLGHTLDARTVAAIGRTDVLLVPVGGFFTIDHKQAADVVDSLDPRIVIPMHYKTPKVDFPIAGVEPFLATQSRVERRATSAIDITRAALPAERVVYVLPSDR
jgi:L-ascorbate metabolism protein UlaG (beta-lactamase superfamily)